ncbi:MAG: hypothetical protein KF795_01755 [Labilithrix sp.]|nr:hypothetical protein [Labilithrix sp.]
MKSCLLVFAIAIGSFACRSTAPTVEMTANSPAPTTSLSSFTEQAAPVQGRADSVLELRLVGDSAELPEFPAMDGTKLQLEKDVLVSAKDVASARTFGASGATVHVKLTPEASASFAEATRRHRGKRLAIVVDGEIAQAPVITSAIEGGNISIDTRSDKEASALVQALQQPQ